MRIFKLKPVKAVIAGLFIGLCGLVSPVLAQAVDAEPVQTQRPDWVEFHSTPAAPGQTPDGISGGLNYLLYDNQHRIERDRISRYRHVSYQIITEAGLSDGARISLDFDPSEQSIAFHSIYVVRNGDVEQRLSADTFTTIRREPDLQSGMVDGNLTSFTELTDIRVGDVVGYEYTIGNSGGVWPGGYASQISLSWGVPLLQQHHRVIVPAGTSLNLKPWREAPAPEIIQSSDRTAYVWQLDNLSPDVSVDNTPAGYPQQQSYSLSNMGSWAEVVEWALPLFPGDLPIPAEAQARLETIGQEHGSPEQVITAVMRYVQDDIRYVAEEIGLGSHFPRTPVEVLDRGYGDCKDKSLLLVVLLRSLGYEADVVLASLSSGYHLPNLAPSPFAFDHAIVRVRLNGQDFWIDPTRTNQGGLLPDLAIPAYGYVLPVAEGSLELVRIETAQPDSPTTETLERFDLQSMEVSGVELTVETTYRGRDADWFRSSLATSSPSRTAQQYLDYYRTRYPGIEVAEPLSIDDDRDINLIRILETYTLSTEAFEADGLRFEFPAYAHLVTNQINRIDAVDRTEPIGIPFPLNNRHVIRFDNSPYRLSGLPDVRLNEEFASYRAITNSRPDGLTMTFSLETLAHSVAATDVASINAMYSGIWDSADLVMNLDRPRATDGFFAWIDTLDDQTLGLMLVALLYVFAFAGAGLGFARDRRLPDTTILYPVSLTKFVLMSLATLNLYHVMWMWRNWRWIKEQDERQISPFARSLFGIFYFAALFNEIKAVAGDKRGLPVMLGSTLAITYMIWLGVSRIADRVVEDTTRFDPIVTFGVFAFGLASTLPLLPIVAMVNRLNSDNPEVVAFTSKILVRDVAMMLVGFGFIALVIIGSFVPV